MKRQLLTIAIWGLSAANAWSQSPNTIYPTGIYPKQAPEKLERFTVSGYYRFITNVRYLQNSQSMLARGSYTDQAKTPTHIFVGDDAQIPQLMLNLGGSVTPSTRFSTDFYLWTPMTGAGQAENVKGLNLGVSLTGTHDFQKGSLNVITGGINWYALTPFTFHKIGRAHV